MASHVCIIYGTKKDEWGRGGGGAEMEAEYQGKYTD